MGKDHVRPVGAGDSITRSYHDFQRKPSSFDNSTKTGSIAKASREKEGAFGSSERPPCKGCRGGLSHSRTSIFCAPVRCAKEMRMEACNRSKSSEQVLSGATFQDGNRSVNQVSNGTRGVCSDARLKGRILSHPNKKTVSEIPKVLHSGSSVQVCSSLLRPVHSSKSLHYGNESSGKVRKKAGNVTPRLLGRLASEKSVSRNSQSPTAKSVRSFGEARNFGQFSKVSTGSKTSVCVSGSEVRPHKSSSIPNSRSSGQIESLVRVFPQCSECSSQGYSEFPRSVESHSRLGTFRKTACQAPSVVPEVLFSSPHRCDLKANTFEGGILQGPTVLGESGRPPGRKLSSPLPGVYVNLFGCQQGGLGCSAGESFSCRPVVPTGCRGTLKCQRNDGHDKGSSVLCSQSQGQHCDAGFGQHHSCSSCSETRGDKILDHVPKDSSALSDSNRIECHSQGKVDAWERFDRSRLFESAESGDGSRVVSARRSLAQASISLSGSSVGSVRNVCQQEASSVYQSLSRSQSSSGRCFFHQLGRLGRVRVPAVQTSSTSFTKDSDRQVLSSSISSSMAGSGLVSDIIESPGGLSQETTGSQEAPVSEERESVSLETTRTPVTRLAIVQQSMQEEGFSEKVSETASLSNRESTRSLYDSRFSKFQEWCQSRQRSLGDMTIQEIAEYFLYLFDQGLQVNTIMGYRSAVSSALGHFSGFTVGSHPVITKLIASFKIQRPVARSYFPAWDLNIVLDVLRKAPFEPPLFGTVAEKVHTTQKTAFLLALASANRASEIHAISRSKRDLIFHKDKIQLRAIAGFVGKTQSSLCDCQPYFIADHQCFVGRDTVDRLLCPKRMVKYYLSFTGGFRDKSRLFYKCLGEGEVKKKTISSWLKNVIVFAYEHSGKTLGGEVSGHDVRRMSTSCAFAAGTNLSDILQAAQWKKCTTFTTHYLKDVQPQPDGVYRMGAVVAGSRL